jgi:hypothetical protein
MAITTSAAASSTTSPAAKQSGFKYYDYKPSEAAGILFASLFLLTTLYHLYQVIRHRAYFFIALTIGGLFEVIGYVARVKSSFETPNWQEGTYIVQALTILVAPSLFAASIYMTLGRIILVTDGERFSIIRRSWLTKIFVAGDVFSFLVLAGGKLLLIHCPQIHLSANPPTQLRLSLYHSITHNLLLVPFVHHAMLTPAQVAASSHPKTSLSSRTGLTLSWAASSSRSSPLGSSWSRPPSSTFASTGTRPRRRWSPTPAGRTRCSCCTLPAC